MENEIKVLIEFLKEFSPLYNDEILLRKFTYDELVDLVKETAEEL